MGSGPGSPPLPCRTRRLSGEPTGLAYAPPASSEHRKRLTRWLKVSMLSSRTARSCARRAGAQHKMVSRAPTRFGERPRGSGCRTRALPAGALAR